tara:strand:+ start:1047 stop:1754 length:708 start_codon:yes stop_codon:yes gene_type:complete
MLKFLKNKKFWYGIGGFISIIILIVAIFRYYRGYTTVKEFLHDAKHGFEVKSNKIKLAQHNKGFSFTHSLWLYVKDWDYRYMNEKFILEKGKFKIYLGAKNNNLYLEIPILNNTRPEIIVYENIPIQKWLNLTIILENRYVDIWINGVLYHSRHLENIPELEPGKDVKYLRNGGFSGHVSRIYHYETNLSKKNIRGLFLAGPISKNPFNKLIHLFKKSVAKVKNLITLTPDKCDA